MQLAMEPRFRAAVGHDAHKFLLADVIAASCWDMDADAIPTVPDFVGTKQI